jgi:hypothetical protein
MRIFFQVFISLCSYAIFERNFHVMLRRVNTFILRRSAIHAILHAGVLKLGSGDGLNLYIDVIGKLGRLNAGPGGFGSWEQLMFFSLRFC